MNQSLIPLIQELKEARIARKLSQRALSELAGVPQGHISNIENGKVNIRITSLFDIARVLELEPMLIPRRIVPAVEGFMMSNASRGEFEPAFSLDEDDDD